MTARRFAGAGVMRRPGRNYDNPPSAAAAPATPLTIFTAAGLYGWWRADAVDNPAAVGSMTDLSGNGLSLTQASVPLRAPVVTVGGLPALAVTGGSGVQSTAASISAGTQPSLFLVTSNGGGTTGTCFAIGATLSTTAARIAIVSGGVIKGLFGLLSDGFTPALASTIANTDTSPHYYGIYLSPSSGTYSFMYDGTEVASTKSGTLTPGQTDVRLGQQIAGIANWAGNIYEAWLPKSAPTAQQLTDASAYVTSRYGV